MSAIAPVHDPVDLLLSEPAARDWFERRRWPHGVVCPSCLSDGAPLPHSRPQPYRCVASVTCGRLFGVKTDTFMSRSNMSLSRWRGLLIALRGSLWTSDPLVLGRQLGVQAGVVALCVIRIQQAWLAESWLPHARSYYGAP